MANPYNNAYSTTGTLSGYFEKEKAKGTKAGGVSPYSAPAEPAGGSAPSAGAASAPSAPKSAAGGGTGFVSFGQYFGANAPAVQAQAQKQAVGAKDMGALNTLQQPGGMQGSAFDQLLGGGVTQREAAKQGQYQFKQLGQRLGGVDTTMGGKTIDAAQAKQAEQTRMAQEQAATAQQQQDLARRVYSASGQRGEWDKLPDWQKEQYLAQAASLMDAEKKKNEILAGGNLG